MAKRNSKHSRNGVLDFLKSHRKLNAVVAQREFGLIGSTLAFYIFELRKAGWNIKTEMKKTYDGTKYAEYTLSADWMLGSEEQKRMDIAMKATAKQMGLEDRAITDFRLGDIIQTSLIEEEAVVVGLLAKGAPRGVLEGLAETDLVVAIAIIDGKEYVANVTLDKITNVKRKGK